MHTVTCKKCGKAYSGSDEKKIKRSLNMHFQRMHGAMRQSKLNAKRKKGITSDKPKRTYRRRTVKQEVHTSGVNFCPNCGSNLSLFHKAVAFAAGVINKTR
jgi:hypothetical protein